MGSDSLMPDVIGFAAELEWNRVFAARVHSLFRDYIDKHGLWTNVSKPNPVPVQRFRLNAIAAYLQRPVSADDIPVPVVERYWELASYCNGMMDRVGGMSTVAIVDKTVDETMKSIPQLLTLTDALSGILGRLRSTR